MASKYFTVEVKPTIPASLQHAAQFGSGNVLFDWTSFQVPRGANKLVNITALVRGKGDSTPTSNNKDFQVVFSKSNTQSLGTPNSNAISRPSNDYLGHVDIVAADYMSTIMRSTTVASVGNATGSNVLPLVIQGDITTGDNVGYDTLYVGSVCHNTSMDFISINAIAENTDADHADSQEITMDGSSMDVRHHFIAGDVVHIGTSVGTPAADSLVGTIASADSTTQITLEAVSPTDLVDGDILYNIHPIRLVLQFER